MRATLYVTRNGLLEPLGQSQVLAYLRGLSQHYRITLITHEKAADWSDAARVAALRDECARLGIRWLPQRFHPRPRLIAPAISMARMGWLLWREQRRQGAALIHARSYLPAAMAMVVGRLTGVPFIFDMRALWPEEMITAGRLRRGSLMHRAIVGLERACLRRAAVVVSLTDAAVVHLRHVYPAEMAGKTVAVIPTCADLDRFVPAPSPPDRHEIGCLGTVLSGWFKTDWLAAFLRVAAQHNRDTVFVLTTRDDPGGVRAAVDPDGRLGARLEIAPAASDRVQEVLQRQTASVMFYAGGEVSELGRSPTRMAEILGCGLPVVANAGVGDVARIIRDHRVGVLVEGPSDAAMQQALSELDALLREPDLALRCRKAAEDVFSLKVGTEKYVRLYDELAS